MSCDFSDLIPGVQCKLSPSSDWIATSVGSRLTILDSRSLVVLRICQCVDKIEFFDFSPDSSYILCALFARNAIQVLSIADGDWDCRINEGVAGIVSACWSYDSRSVITESDFGIQLSIWSLLDSSCHLISNPKQSIVRSTSSAKAGHTIKLTTFSDCGRMLAVVHRIELHDHIGIFSTSPWNEISKFQCRSNDISSIQWTPNGAHLVVVDSPLTYKFLVYTPSGELLMSYEAYQHALGIRHVSFIRESLYSFATLVDRAESAARMTALVAIGSYDGNIRLLSTRSWELAFVLPLLHPKDIDPSLLYEQMPMGLSSHHEKSRSALLDEDGSERDSGPVSPQMLTSDLSGGEGWRGILMEVACAGPNGGDDSMDSLLENTAGAANRGGLLTESFRTTNTKPTSSTGSRYNSLRAQAGKGTASAAGRLATVTAVSIAARPSVYSRRSISSLRTLPSIKPDVTSSKGLPPAMGVSWLDWSAGGRYLAARNDSNPRCLWIWCVEDVKIADLLVQLDPILCARWRPVQAVVGEGGAMVPAQPLLAFCTGSPRVYFWMPGADPFWADLPEPDYAGAEAMMMGDAAATSKASAAPAAAMGVTSLQWGSNGCVLLLSGRESSCTCDVSFGFGVSRSERASDSRRSELSSKDTATAQHGQDS